MHTDKAKPTVLYYSVLQYQPENISLLHEAFNVVESASPADDMPEMLGKADVVFAPLGFYFGREKMEQAPRLKVIASNTTGHPHIDIAAAQAKKITVVTLKNYRDFLNAITPTAELTWGLIIALTRNVIAAQQAVKEGRWDRRPFGGRRMLSRMTLGIAGMGRLGSIVAGYAKSFGMQTYYYDPVVQVEDTYCHRVSTLKELVSSCDIITIHIPHEPKTENLFNREIIFSCKQGLYLVNTSRGELLDHQALLECLQSGRLAGAALDVFPQEFDPDFTAQLTSHPLIDYARKHQNLIITPHIGGSTQDAWFLTERFTIEKTLEVLGQFSVNARSASS